MSTLSPGTRLGRYEVISPLGSGGMGVVYRARDPQLDREVAIKLLPEELSADENRLARMTREARATAALNHPNLLAIYDIGTHEGTLYLVTELLEGETLRQRLARSQIDWQEALSVTRDVASGLAAAHDKGIIHRDLKPENLFVLVDGRAKILDFGLATVDPNSVLGEAGLSTDRTLDQLTRDGVVLGTVGYMAPEQVDGKPSDARSDLFSLGVILYEMLTGRAPFRRDSSIESLHAILKDEPEELATQTVDLPDGLARLVRHLMEKDPATRFQSARDLRYDLDGIESRTSSRLPSPVSRPSPRRWPLVLGLTAIAVLVGVRAIYRNAGSRDSGLASTSLPASDQTVSIAVLPFEKRGASADLDHLALGLPDEIVTELSYAKELAVRSFTQSSRFTTPASDLADVGTKLGVSHLIVGLFGLEGESIRVSVEAIDLATNKVVWRDNWGAAGNDLLGLRDAMRSRISEGLLPALGQNRSSLESAASGPGSAEAYDLYLKASTVPFEPALNLEAMVTLQHSLEIDPGFAPAWLALAKRQKFDSTLAEGGSPAGSQHAYDSVSRALELDPNLFEARRYMLTQEVERGNLIDAFKGAANLVRGRPDSGLARVTMAYVLRYGGAIEESSSQCEEALRLDPKAKYHRLCHWTHAHAGAFDQALESIELYSSAETLRRSLRADIFARRGDRQAALAEIEDATDDLAAMDIQRACLQVDRPAALPVWIAERRSRYEAWGDPEGIYWYAALMADCGFPEEALHFLALSIDRSYCVASALDVDPLWDSILSDPLFQAQRERSQECHERFMEERAG